MSTFLTQADRMSNLMSDSDKYLLNVQTPKRKRGRPPGSLNKKKKINCEIKIQKSGKKRGRPKGSKNKPKDASSILKSSKKIDQPCVKKIKLSPHFLKSPNLEDIDEDLADIDELLSSDDGDDGINYEDESNVDDSCPVETENGRKDEKTVRNYNLLKILNLKLLNF